MFFYYLLDLGVVFISLKLVESLNSYLKFEHIVPLDKIYNQNWKHLQLSIWYVLTINTNEISVVNISNVNCRALNTHYFNCIF